MFGNGWWGDASPTSLLDLPLPAWITMSLTTTPISFQCDMRQIVSQLFGNNRRYCTCTVWTLHFKNKGLVSKQGGFNPQLASNLGAQGPLSACNLGAQALSGPCAPKLLAKAVLVFLQALATLINTNNPNNSFGNSIFQFLKLTST